MPRSASDCSAGTDSDNKIEDDMDYIAKCYLKPINIRRKKETGKTSTQCRISSTSSSPKTQASKDRLRCAHCSLVFTKYSELSNHLLNVIQDKRKKSKSDFECKICKMHFTDKVFMLKHYKDSHSTAIEHCSALKQNQPNPECSTNLNNLGTDKHYLCQICQEYFDDKNACLDHKMEVHANVPKYQKIFTARTKQYNERESYKVPIVKLERLAINTTTANSTLPSYLENNDITQKSQTTFQRHLTDVNKSKHFRFKHAANSKDMSSSTSRQNSKESASLLDKILLNNGAKEDVIQKEAMLSDEDDLTKLYQCDSCKLHYVEFDYIKKHSRNCLGRDINNSLAATCNICNISFFYKELEKHCVHHNMGIKEFDFITVMNSKRAKTNTRSGELMKQVYACETCEMNFCSKAFFQRHKTLKRHRTDIDDRCQICGLRFYIKCLPVHLESHINNYDENINLSMSNFSSRLNKKALRDCEKDKKIKIKNPSLNESNIDALTKVTFDTQKAVYQKKRQSEICDDNINENELEHHLAHHTFSFEKKAISKGSNQEHTTLNEKLGQRMLENTRAKSSKNIPISLRESLISKYIKRYNHDRGNAVKNNETCRKYTKSGNNKYIRKSNKLLCKNIKKYLYKCSLCDLYFLTLSGLKKHVLRRAHAVKGLNCKHCGYTFSKLSLKWHVNLHHIDLKLKRDNFIIRDCSMYIPEAELKKIKESSEQTKSNPEHINKELNNEMGSEQLDIGNNILNESVENKQNNESGHDNDKSGDDNDKISNDNNDYIISNENELRNNDKITFMKKTFCVRLYLCNDCNVHFVTISTYINHIKEHILLTSSDFNKCNHCGLNFINVDLNMHVNEHHSNANNLTVLVESPILDKGITEYKSYDMPPINIDKLKQLGNNVDVVNISSVSANKSDVIDNIYTIGVQKNMINTERNKSKRNTFLSRCTSCRSYVIAKNDTDNQNGDIICEKCKEVREIDDQQMFLDKSTLLNDNTVPGTVSNYWNAVSDFILDSSPIRFRRRTTSNSINYKLNTFPSYTRSKDVGCNTENEIENSKETLEASKNTNTTYKIHLKEGEFMREFIEIKTDDNKTIKLQFVQHQSLAQANKQSNTAEIEEIRQISSISKANVEKYFDNIREISKKYTHANTNKNEINNRNDSYSESIASVNNIINRTTELNKNSKSLNTDEIISKSKDNATNNNENTENLITIDETEKESIKICNPNVFKQSNYTIVLSDDEDDIIGSCDIKQHVKDEIFTNIKKTPNHNSVIIIDDDDVVIVPKTKPDVTAITKPSNGKHNETVMTKQSNEKGNESVITEQSNEKEILIVMTKENNGKENETVMTKQNNEKENKTVMIEQSHEKVMTRQRNEKTAILPPQVIKTENGNIKKEIVQPSLDNIIKIEEDFSNSVTGGLNSNNSISSKLFDCGVIKGENIVSNGIVKVEAMTE